MRTHASTVALSLWGLWALWALGDMQQRASHKPSPRPAATAALQAAPPPRQAIPDRSGLTYWPGP